ncbi:tripartite tricarboxylate transporter permease [Halolamina sp. CBA1230]|uniref:tripartite tricarboxylate transporter permease n=1 Tax=Halolamina sp. CBA1230 TaxID=1853690 RepID=UPI0009A1ADE6|nr:tripartite tricarboxylate transporter permease [Halolamina sp. CBA1230]QKY20226.1 tripartite tricarboxylate transporter permease [Halolamina sp. CBA1230]
MWSPPPLTHALVDLLAAAAGVLGSVAGVPLGPRADTAALVPVALATVAGCLLGTCSGLVPGLHANNFALLLAGAAPQVPLDPLALGAAMLAAGVVHTFLDIVPSLALGVPDGAMAAAALPGHRLVLRGRGREALRLSALGSGAAVAVATLLAFPVTWAMLRLAPLLTRWFPLVAAAVLAVLLATEPSHSARLAGLLAFGVATALGAAVLGLSLSGPITGGVLAPLFGGLFGAPVLLDALHGGGVPEQDDAALAIPPLDLGVSAAAGGFSGAAVGYLPGVSAGVAATVSLPAVPARSDLRGFVVATSGANSSTAVFSLFALVALGAPRSGVLVAVDDAGVPLSLSVLLPVVVVAAATGFVLVGLLGDAAFRVVSRLDQRRLAVAVLCLLVALSALFAGPAGVAVFSLATLVGLIAVRIGARRVYLMGVLLGPLALGL